MALSSYERAVVRLLARHDQEIAALKNVLIYPFSDAESREVIDRIAELEDNSLRLTVALRSAHSDAGRYDQD